MKINILLVTGILLAAVSAHAQWEEWGDEGPKQNGTDFQNRQANEETSKTAAVKEESISQQPVPEPLTEKDLQRESVSREVDAVDFNSNNTLNSERLNPRHDEMNKSQRLVRAEQKIAARDKERKSKHHKAHKQPTKKVARHKKAISKTTVAQQVAQHKRHKTRNIASVHAKAKAKKHHSHSHMSQAVAAN